MMFLRIAKKIKVLMRQILPSAKKLKARKLEEKKRKNKINFLLSKISQGDVLHVMNGPFQGMKYIATASGSQLLPKILGSYEEPIHEWVRERILGGHYETIIDVGCADGYYAIGFALGSPKSKIIAFDIDTSALANATHLAMTNKVNHRVEFSEKFDTAVISSELETGKEKKILIFMDVEGAELDLLDSKKNESLLNCDVLVELHDCFIPGLTEKVISFFSETHKIEIIVDYPWREGEYKKDEPFLSQEDLNFCLDERRPKEMRWMFAKRK